MRGGFHRSRLTEFTSMMVHLIHEDSDSASRLIVVIWIEMKCNFWLFGNYFDWKSISQHLKQC